jgi:hypothetical protein
MVQAKGRDDVVHSNQKGMILSISVKEQNWMPDMVSISSILAFLTPLNRISIQLMLQKYHTK